MVSFQFAIFRAGECILKRTFQSAPTKPGLDLILSNLDPVDLIWKKIRADFPISFNDRLEPFGQMEYNGYQVYIGPDDDSRESGEVWIDYRTKPSYKLKRIRRNKFV